MSCKNRNIYGSLNEIWSYLEDINGWKDDTINVDINTLLICTQQTVLLLGQTIKSILCYRRYNAFFSVMSYSDSKMVLNDQSNEMSEEGYPFGKKLKVIFQRIKGRKLKQWSSWNHLNLQPFLNQAPHQKIFRKVLAKADEVEDG